MGHAECAIVASILNDERQIIIGNDRQLLTDRLFDSVPALFRNAGENATRRRTPERFRDGEKFDHAPSIRTSADRSSMRPCRPGPTRA